MNGLMYVLGTGCQWRAIPKDLSPRSTVNYYFRRWQHDGTLDRLHLTLYVLWQEQADSGNHRQPERQVCRKRGRRIDLSGFDAGKRIMGEKRHVLVD